MKSLTKKILKISIVIIIVLFLIIYINKENNYVANDYVISEESIKRFENDLKEGKEIIPSNYINQKKDYNNKLSLFGLKLSNLIERGVNIVLDKLLQSITS